ncbi:hypothetical protein HBI56_005100 [Parastagonospora nodorum]|nr:hypothetical protein HBH56_124570 [Parastagonospora nodorum]QRC91220.1 hypothetical protein JI435_007190 [Parastagonospora nodorum SN15]KAH3934707.1 hypothetical protein HBH54_050110 [Parastagonospora nodorum]KAH3972427.1 hypothetical protein HBH52_154130 [Parastagonospora nodorum]KAH3982734.1 hypothetical protein HBH51_037020 [Parastagonospora nodorum]
MMKGPPVRFEVKEMVVIALLMSWKRQSSTRGIQEIVRDLFGPGMNDMIVAISRQEEMDYDNDFPVVADTTSQGLPIHSLPSGQENMLLERLYGLGPVGYIDDNTIPRLDLLSLKVRKKILRLLLKFETPLHVQLVPSGRYSFAVFGPYDDPSGGLPAFHDRQVGPVDNLLAIATARPEIHGLALEVFYQENSFVLGPFLTMEDQPDSYLYHLGHWKLSIGWKACSYLRENVFEG